MYVYYFGQYGKNHLPRNDPKGYIYRESMREAFPNPSGLIYLGLSHNNKTYEIGGLFYVQTLKKI